MESLIIMGINFSWILWVPLVHNLTAPKNYETQQLIVIHRNKSINLHPKKHLKKGNSRKLTTHKFE